MKNQFLSLALSMALLLTGCASTLTGSSANEPEQTSVASKQEVQEIQETVQQPQPVEEKVTKTIVYLDDTKIDFNQITIECDISEQLVYIKQQDKVVRVMPTSSGLDQTPDDSTPRGEFVIEPERGEWFFSNQYQEGAKYWVSFKNHGEFLFHSIVMDANQQVIAEEAKKLGQKASHGCFRMAVEDAKWIYDHIKTGTKVIIRD